MLVNGTYDLFDRTDCTILYCTSPHCTAVHSACYSQLNSIHILLYHLFSNPFFLLLALSPPPFPFLPFLCFRVLVLSIIILFFFLPFFFLFLHLFFFYSRLSFFQSCLLLHSSSLSAATPSLYSSYVFSSIPLPYLRP